RDYPRPFSGSVLSPEFFSLQLRSAMSRRVQRCPRLAGLVGRSAFLLWYSCRSFARGSDTALPSIARALPSARCDFRTHARACLLFPPADIGLRQRAFERCNSSFGHVCVYEADPRQPRQPLHVSSLLLRPLSESWLPI